MPLIRKNARTPKWLIEGRRKLTADGGLLLVEALCRRLKLWDSINLERFPPVTVLDGQDLGARPNEAIIAQLLFSFARGGASIADAAMMQSERLLLRLLGLRGAADEKVLAAWLSGQAPESVGELRRLNAQFVHSALNQLFPVQKDEVGDPDSQRRDPMVIALREKEWEFSRNGTVATTGLGSVRQCWRTLAVGPFLLDSVWSTESNAFKNSSQANELVTLHRDLWKGRETYFSGRSMPDGETWRALMGSVGCSLWSAQVNQDVIYRACNFTPESNGYRWVSAASDDLPFAQYLTLYPAQGRQNIMPGVGLVARTAKDSHGINRLRFLVVSPGTTMSPQWFFQHYFGESAVMDQVLREMNLEQHLSLGNHARDALFSIASLAYNLLTALRIWLRPEAVHWTTRETIRGIIATPVRLSSSGNRESVHFGASPEWPANWQEFIGRLFPSASGPRVNAVTDKVGS